MTMSHITANHIVDWLGLLSGVVGVSIAIWLQLIMPKKCQPRYVLGFLFLGSALILMNLDPIWISQDIVFGRLVAYLMLIIGQIYVGYRVYKVSNSYSPYTLYEESIRGKFGGDK